ncbi:MAG: hypothetical protein ACP5G4_09395, partial [bacterium]
MRSKLAIWTLPIAILALLAFSFPVFAQGRTMSETERERMPEREIERRDVTPLESRDESPVIPPAEAIMERTLDGGSPPPIDPGHVMDTESEDIYIYVTLMAPEGPPPPDSVVITQITCTPGSEEIRFKANATPFFYGADWYHVYRDTVCLFYSTQLDSNNLLPTRGTGLYYTDLFTDTLWAHYPTSSKGVCDTLVNLFYVFTSVDSGPTAPGGFAESAFPSWPLCEYDQTIKSNPVTGSYNVVSIPCYDDDVTRAIDFAAWGATSVQEWNAATQTWSTIGSQLFPGTWVPNGNIMVSHSYRFSGAGVAAQDIFSTFEPGIVPQDDTTYTLYSSTVAGNRNIIMLPFKVSYIDNITNCATLAASIVAAGATEVTRVERWNNATMTWSTVGSQLFPGT